MTRLNGQKRSECHVRKVCRLFDATTQLNILEVVTSKDSPGFIANAILMPMINEAIMVLEKVSQEASHD